MENNKPFPKYKRRQYLVRTKFQLSYIGLILTLIFITAAICSYVVYYTSIVTLGEKLAAVYPQGRLYSIVKMVNMRILFSMVLITPIIVLVGIYYSHKVAGPIFRIERYLKNFAAGDMTERIFLRKGDELVSVANGLNNVRESVIAMLDEQKERIDSLSGEVLELKNALPPEIKSKENIVEIMDNMQSDIRTIRAGLDKYKLRK